MRQAPQAIDAIAAAFDLTDAERHLLLSARRGEALLVAGSHRVRFEVVASAEEHPMLLSTAQATARARRPRCTARPPISPPTTATCSDT